MLHLSKRLSDAQGTFRPLGLGAFLSLTLLFSCAGSQQQRRAADTQTARTDAASAKQSALTIPASVSPEDHIFIQARVNNSGPLWFILDTGSDDLLINANLAQTLGLKLGERTDVGGAGENIVEASLARGITFGLPGAELINQTATVVALNDLEEDTGRAVAGIIGFPLLSRYVVEVDYASQSVRLHDPAHFEYRGAGEEIPLTIERNHPHVRAKVTLPGRQPLDAKFLVDTGAASVTSLLTRPFVESNELLKSVSKTVALPGARGMGGDVSLHLGRAKSLQLGRFVFDAPVVGFFQDRGGFGASKEVDGLVGNELLRRFKVFFDYERRRMILEPNAALADPFESSMSGFRPSTSGPDFKTFRVRRIIAGSPASEAGLREGDEITAIDGRAAREFKPHELLRMFKREGRDYVLSVRRGSQPLELKLRTRRLI